MFKKKFYFVTRFIGYARDFNKKEKAAKFTAFLRSKDIKDGEISVYGIDDELNNDQSKIFELGDKKVYKKGKRTLAHAVLKVSDVREIKTAQETLRVDTGFTKHCNIRPIPNDELLAQNIATQLAFISKLYVRADFGGRENAHTKRDVTPAPCRANN